MKGQNNYSDIDYGKEVIRLEAEGIKKLIDRIDNNFQVAVDLIFECKGRTVVTGIGKAGIIGQKISATLASTGSPSYWIHPSEARHGDLGRIVKEDVVLALSNSGETEVKLLIPFIKKIGAKIIAITGNLKSSLAIYSDVALNIGRIEEACPLRLAPSASSAAMLALGDALALTVLKKKNFTKADYAFYHPGGELGKRLLTVEMVMRSGDANPIATEDILVSDALKIMTETKYRPGAVSIVNQSNKLIGFFTDGDLRRCLQSGVEFLHHPIKEVMTLAPKTVKKNSLALDAYKILREYKIDQLPVVDEDLLAVGIIDVQDILDMGY